MRYSTKNAIKAPLLAEELSVALGRPVAVSVARPTTAGGRGTVDVVDAATGAALPETPDGVATFRRVVDDHQAPAPAKSDAEQLLDALDKAATVDDLKTALRSFAARRVARERTRKAARA